MKLLIITAAFPPMTIAGEADHAFHLCKHLVDFGLDVHVLTTRGNSKADGLEIEVSPLMQKWSWSEMPRLARVMLRSSPDGVILMYSGGRLYRDHRMITFVPALAKILLPRVPFVTQFENVFSPSCSSLFGRALRRLLGPLGTLLSHSKHIIVLSDRQRHILSKYRPGVGNKCVLIPPPPLIQMSQDNSGVPRQRGRKSLCVNPEDFVILYFGYIYPGKGMETLLEAFQEVAAHRNNVWLLVVGSSLGKKSHPAYPQHIHELPKQLGISDKVLWKGSYSWDTDEASIYLRSADVCVLPFDNGAYLNNSSLAAAAAHGLPIITTRGEMAVQAFRHKENVLLCPPKSPKEMAAAIETLMENPDLRQRLCEGSIQLTRDWFSWEKAIKRTVATFSDA